MFIVGLILGAVVGYFGRPYVDAYLAKKDEG